MVSCIRGHRGTGPGRQAVTPSYHPPLILDGFQGSSCSPGVGRLSWRGTANVPLLSLSLPSY